MDNNEILTIGDRTYSISKLGAIQQFHVSRRLGPLLTKIVPILNSMRPQKDATTGNLIKVSLLDIPMERIMSLTETFADLPDETLDYIIASCLSVVTRDMGSGMGWTPVWNKAANRPQFDDMDLPTILRLLSSTVWFNFQGFISGASMLGNPGAAKDSPQT